MLKIIVGFLFVIQTCLLQVSYASCTKNLNAEVQKVIDDTQKKYAVPGIEVSIICPGEDAPRDFVSGAVKIEGSQKLKSKNLFQIGSETKSFVSAIILQLESEGKLSIHDPIRKYLINIPGTWEIITIQQLLNHTSGLFSYDRSPDFMQIALNTEFQKEWMANELINFAIKEDPYFEPGKGWHYSNTNYVLTGMIIEKVTGNTLEHEISERILKPLHLHRTHYIPTVYSPNVLKQMAHGYSKLGLFSDEPKDITYTNMSWGNAAGAIVSTSHDVAIWLHKLLTTNLVLPNAKLREMMATVDEMGQPLPNTSKSPGYGLGIARDFDPELGEVWWHNGGTLGYLSEMVYLKDHDILLTTIISHSAGDANSGNKYLLTHLLNLIVGSDLQYFKFKKELEIVNPHMFKATERAVLIGVDSFQKT